jgi:hypothetical protein
MGCSASTARQGTAPYVAAVFALMVNGADAAAYEAEAGQRKRRQTNSDSESSSEDEGEEEEEQVEVRSAASYEHGVPGQALSVTHVVLLHL